MARNTARKPEVDPDVEKAERHAEAHRARRVAEPAAVPLETDAEAGNAHPESTRPGIPASAGDSSERAAKPKTDRDRVSRTGPADTYMVNSDGEVRAGPGDAGKQSAPRVLDNPQDTAPRSNKALLIGLAVGVALMLLIVLISG